MKQSAIALFTGDSITDMCRRTDPSGFLGAGYVRRIAEMAATEKAPLRVINTGVSGDRTTDLLTRWDADVIDRAPDILTILVGVNDTWRRYDAGIPMSTAEYAANYAVLLEQVRSRLDLRQLVIMEPFLVPITTEQERWPADDLDGKRAVARETAARFDATFIPLNEIFSAHAEADGPMSVIDDGVHPSAGGHELIAQTWWSSVMPLLP